MIDPKTLLPEVQKLLPEYSPQELIAGIQEFVQAHPDFTNQQALQALTAAMAHPTVQAARKTKKPAGKPFEGLLSQLPQGVK